MGLLARFKGKSIGEHVAEADALGITVVDVREPSEFARGHIPGAVNVPLGSLADVVKVAPDKTEPLYVHCQSGMRSSRACKQLQSMGYAHAVNIGGIKSYRGPVDQSD